MGIQEAQMQKMRDMLFFMWKVRKLVELIIKDLEREIAQMKA